MRKLYLFFVGLALFGGDIEFNISLNKERYLEREPIWVRCIAKNNGNTPKKILSFKAGMLEGINFFFIPDDPNNIIQRIPIYFDSAEPLIQLAPGESLVVYRNLLRKVESAKGLPKKDMEFLKKRGLIKQGVLKSVRPRLSLLYGYLKPDRYKLYARYRTRWYEKDGREDIYSDTVELEVITPTGEEKEALELFEAEKYKEIFERYPFSVYAPHALYVYEIKNKNKSVLRKKPERHIEILLKFFENYPDYPKGQYSHLVSLLEAYSAMGKLEEGKEKLRSISEKYPKSDLSKKIKEILEFTKGMNKFGREEIIRFYNRK